MQKVVISYPVGEPFYCPFCGTQTIPPLVDGQDTEFKKCEHLLYIGTDEGGFEYLNDRIKGKISDEMGEEELTELNIEDGIHFSLCDLPPSAFGAYVAYEP